MQSNGTPPANDPITAEIVWRKEDGTIIESGSELRSSDRLVLIMAALDQLRLCVPCNGLDLIRVATSVAQNEFRFLAQAFEESAAAEDDQNGILLPDGTRANGRGPRIIT